MKPDPVLAEIAPPVMVSVPPVTLVKRTPLVPPVELSVAIVDAPRATPFRSSAVLLASMLLVAPMVSVPPPVMVRPLPV